MRETCARERAGPVCTALPDYEGLPLRRGSPSFLLRWKVLPFPPVAVSVRKLRERTLGDLPRVLRATKWETRGFVAQTGALPPAATCSAHPQH